MVIQLLIRNFARRILKQRIFMKKLLFLALMALMSVGMQAQQNERLGAKLLFQFKLVGGYHINNNWALELFMHHFSNGNTAPENYSYAFYGLGVTYSF